jgi:hypothetical protein
VNLFVANLILRRELDFAVSRPFRGSLWGKYHNRVFLPGDCTIEGYFFSVPNPEYSRRSDFVLFGRTKFLRRLFSQGGKNFVLLKRTKST